MGEGDGEQGATVSQSRVTESRREHEGFTERAPSGGILRGRTCDTNDSRTKAMTGWGAESLIH